MHANNYFQISPSLRNCLRTLQINGISYNSSYVRLHGFGLRGTASSLIKEGVCLPLERQKYDASVHS